MEELPFLTRGLVVVQVGAIVSIRSIGVLCMLRSVLSFGEGGDFRASAGRKGTVLHLAIIIKVFAVFIAGLLVLDAE